MAEAPDLFSIIDFYIDDLFAPQDAASRHARRRTPHRPAKPLYLLAKMVGGRRVLDADKISHAA